jgi:hypothetical protein
LYVGLVKFKRVAPKMTALDARTKLGSNVTAAIADYGLVPIHSQLPPKTHRSSSKANLVPFRSCAKSRLRHSFGFADYVHNLRMYRSMIAFASLIDFTITATT